MRRKHDLVLYLLLSLVILLVVFVRLRLLNVPLERDEGEYAYAGQLMLKGIPPYAGVYNMKFPGTYTLYFLIELLFGQTVTGIHLGALFSNLLSILFVFLIGKKLMSLHAGIVSAISFAILSLSTSFQGLDANAESFVLLFSLPGILILIYAIEKNRPLYFFLSGTFLGLSVLMKQHGIFFLVFGGVLIIYHYAIAEKGRLSSTFFPLLQLCSGALFTFLLSLGFLAQAGVLQNFWLLAFQYAKEYISQRSINEAIQNFPFRNIFMASPMLWSLGLLGVVNSLFKKGNGFNSFFLLNFGFFSFLTVCPGFYFRPHYFILLLPAVSLLIANAIHPFSSLSNTGLTSYRRIILLLIVAPILFFIISNRSYLFIQTPKEASKQLYPKESFCELLEISSYLKKNTLPSDKIGVLGSEPEIFFYTQRESASGFIYCYPLLEDQKFRKQMETKYIAEVERASPKYFLVVNVNQNWSISEVHGERISDWYPEFLRNNYNLAAMVCFPGNSSPVYIWNNPPEFPNDSLIDRIEVYRRNQ
ncbi:MAG: glycosyltransferase family 39 protein [Bacteroidota bacterium]